MLSLREIARQHARLRLLVYVLLALIASGGMFAQQIASPQNGTASEQLPAGCRNPNAPKPGVATFEDKLSGFRFNYPASLELTEGDPIEIASVSCGYPPQNVLIMIEVNIGSKPELPAGPDNSVLKERTGDIEWEEVLSESRAELCTFAHDENVCLDGAANSRQDSTEYLNVLRMIGLSFAFTDPADRMDAKIAAMKVGDHLGNLTVKRVVTRTMALRNPRRYSLVLGAFGEVDFSGEMNLTGSIYNDRTMNSGDHWVFDPELDRGSPFPFYVDKTMSQGIHFRNSRFFVAELKRLGFPENVVATIKNVSVVFGPLGSWSTVSADLVSLTSTESNN